MIFKRRINGQVDVIMTFDFFGIIPEEEIGTHGWVGTRVDRDSLPFERRQELRIEMTRCGVGQPEALREEFGEDNGRGLGLYNRDRLGAGGCPCEEVETEETVLGVPEI